MRTHLETPMERRASAREAVQHRHAMPRNHPFAPIRAAAAVPAARQTDLRIGSSSSNAEHEADHIADRVMRMPVGNAPIEAQRAGDASSAGIPVPRVVDEALASPGRPLDIETRTFFESRFGRDFGAVRVHTDAKSARSAAAIGSSAYTHGNDVVLGTGSSIGDRRLMAHELAHVAQNAGGADPNIVRRSPQKSNFGVFKDNLYHDLVNNAGKAAGVEITILFHPGDEVQADLIGLTQAVKTTRDGALDKLGVGPARRATSGVGAGFEIDRVAGAANPIYPAQKVKPGGKKENLGDYDTWPIRALSSTEQAQKAATSNISNRQSTGWGTYGYRKLIGGAFQKADAQLHDTPNLGGATPPNSEQIFETAALAVAGPQEGTYYGSVEWGWRIDAAGNFRHVPFKLVSEGLPTAKFLTAASVWNPAKTDLAYIVTRDTTLEDNKSKILATVHAGTRLAGGGSGKLKGKQIYFEVTYHSRSGYIAGYIDSAKVRATTTGADTLDLPIPLVYTVSNPAGTKLQRSDAISASGGSLAQLLYGEISLPKGTRLEVRRSMTPTATRPNHYEVVVAQGAYTGEKGYVFALDVSKEVLGKR